MAEGEGFEPPVRFPVQWFSRPPVSTAHTTLRVSSLTSLYDRSNWLPCYWRCILGAYSSRHGASLFILCSQAIGTVPSDSGTGDYPLRAVRDLRGRVPPNRRGKEGRIHSREGQTVVPRQSRLPV